jgi:hypothetical protein
MGRKEHKIEIKLWIEPDEHTEEAPAWDALVERVRAVVDQARADPQFAPIAFELEDCFSFHGDYEGVLYKELFAEWGIPYMPIAPEGDA